MTIYNKYKRAFKVEYNYLQVADFIEYILSEEPERTGLLLAAGLVYDELEDQKLAYEYYCKYLAVNHNSAIEGILKKRIEGFAQSELG